MEEYTFLSLKITYPALKLDNKRKVEYLYIYRHLSIPDFKRLFGVSSRRMYFLLNYLGIPVRNIKEANSSSRKKCKVIETSRKKYGTDNVLCRGTDAYIKRNETVLNRYGVINVFQLPEVKRKINEVCLEKFGKLRITNPEAISKARLEFPQEKKDEISRKRKETISKWSEKRKNDYHKMRGEITRNFWKRVNDDFLNGRFLNQMNKVESKVSESLKYVGLEYKFSKFVSRRQFDFHVLGTNFLIEVQGDFWHANPSIYSLGEVLNLPGRGGTLVESIWENDRKKIKLAESKGYLVLQLWENDVRRKSIEELGEDILCYLNSLRTSSPVISSTLT